MARKKKQPKYAKRKKAYKLKGKKLIVALRKKKALYQQRWRLRKKLKVAPKEQRGKIAKQLRDTRKDLLRVSKMMGIYKPPLKKEREIKRVEKVSIEKNVPIWQVKDAIRKPLKRKTIKTYIINGKRAARTNVERIYVLIDEMEDESLKTGKYLVDIIIDPNEGTLEVKWSE